MDVDLSMNEQIDVERMVVVLVEHLELLLAELLELVALAAVVVYW